MLVPQILRQRFLSVCYLLATISLAIAAVIVRPLPRPVNPPRVITGPKPVLPPPRAISPPPRAPVRPPPTPPTSTETAGEYLERIVDFVDLAQNIYSLFQEGNVTYSDPLLTPYSIYAWIQLQTVEINYWILPPHPLLVGNCEYGIVLNDPESLTIFQNAIVAGYYPCVLFCPSVVVRSALDVYQGPEFPVTAPPLVYGGIPPRHMVFQLPVG